MDRVTLPKVVHTVEIEDEPEIVRRASIPAGESLPAWEHIPLDAKFPMIPAPKGSVVLATTDLSHPRHCATKEHDFDLTDPNALIMSNDYSALHDPHLKTHFSSLHMRKHLIQNGFITAEGQVVCSLREFNEYRRYLRKLCLLELARERKQKEKEAMNGADDKTDDKERKVIQDLRARIREQEKVQRQRLADSLAESAKRMVKRQKDLLEKQLERETKRKQGEDKRRQIISQIHKSEQDKSLKLMEKRELQDRKRQARLENIRREQVRNQQNKVISKWNARRRFQENRLADEAEKREQIDREKQKRVENRKNRMKRHWQRLEEHLRHLRDQAATKRDSVQRKYDRRMSMMSGDGRGSKRSALRSPFKSIWVLEKVLRRLSFPDISHKVTAEGAAEESELWDFLDGVINQAVDVLNTDGGAHELNLLREGAQALVQKTLDGITQEMFSDRLKCIDEPCPKPEDDITHEGTEVEHLVISTEEASTSAESILSQTEEIGSEGSPVDPLHHQTMEIHGIPLNILRHSMMRLDKDLPDNAVLDTKTAVSDLHLLLDDIAVDRCSRRELEMIVGYAAPGRGWWDSGTNNIVEIMLKSILSELRTGSVNNEGLTQLILSLVGESTEQAEAPPDHIQEFLSAVVQEITNQLELDSLTDSQIQCLTNSISTLFLDPELEIAGTIVGHTLSSLVKGATGSDKQRLASTRITKALVAKVLKHMAFFISGLVESTQIPTQTANSIVSETMVVLGEHLTVLQNPQKNAVGSSIIAEWIVSQALNELAQHGPVQQEVVKDSSCSPELAKAARSIANDVTDSVKGMLATVQISQQENDQPPAIKDIAQIIVKYMADPSSVKSSQIDMGVPTLAMNIVGNMLKQIANIISSTNSNTVMPDDAEAEYMFAKSLVAETLAQMAHRMTVDNLDDNKSKSPATTQFTTQMLSEATDSGLVSTVVCENLLRHESSSVALQILLETLKQLTSLFSDEEDSKASKRASKIVEDSLRVLSRLAGDGGASVSAPSIVSRIVKETLKGLSGTPADENDRKDSHKCDSSVNVTVFNTLQGLLEASTEVLTSTDRETDGAEFELLAKDMACETLQHMVKSLLNGSTGVTTVRCGKGKSITSSKLIYETISQLTKVLLFSTAIIQENIDLDSCYVASQLVRHTLQQFTEIMVRSISDIQPDQTSLRNDPVITGIQKMAQAISDASVCIGDDRNLTLPGEWKKLVNMIKENLINLTDDKVPTDVYHALSFVLKKTACSVSESLLASDTHLSDTLVLANRIVSDILDDLAAFVASGTDCFLPTDNGVTTNSILQNIVQGLDSWAAVWTTMAKRVTIYDFSGCSLIAGDIVKRFVAKLAINSFNEESKFSEARQHFAVTSAVSTVLNRLAFGAILVVDQSVDVFENSNLGKQTDYDIMNHLLQGIKENSLSAKDIICLAEVIIPSYSLVNFPTLNNSNSAAIVDFINDLLTKFQEEIQANEMTDADLSEIRDYLFHPDRAAGVQRRFADFKSSGSVNIKELIENVHYLAKDGELRQSEKDRIARYLLQAEPTHSTNVEGSTQSAMQQSADRIMDDVLSSYRHRLSVGEFSRDDLKKAVGRIVEACALHTVSGNDSEVSISKVIDVLKTVTELNSLASDIEDGAFTSYEISLLAYAVASSTSGKQPVLSISEISTQQLNVSLVSAITDQLSDILLNLQNGRMEMVEVERISSIALARNVDEPLSKNLIDPPAWRGLSDLLQNVIRTLSDKMRSRIASLTTPTRSVQILCDDALPSTRYIMNRNTPKLSLRGTDQELVKNFVQCTLETIILRTTVSRSTEEMHYVSHDGSKTEAELLQKSHLKRRSVDSKTAKTILVALSKTYKDLEEAICYPGATIQQDVGVSVQRALLQLIHDIDLKHLSISHMDSVEDTLMKWWKDNKATYESVASDDAKKIVSSLVDRIKFKSKIIGPPRQHELFATVKITEERVRDFVKELERDEPELLTAVSTETLLSPSFSVAKQIVQAVLCALEDDTWMDEELKAMPKESDSDTVSARLATKTVSTVLKRVKSEFTDELAQGITDFLIQRLKTEDSTSELEKVTLDKPFEISDSPSQIADELVQAITSELRKTSTSSWTAEGVVQSLMHVLKDGDAPGSSLFGLTPSGIAQKTVELTLQHVIDSDLSSDKELSEILCTPDSSYLAKRAVESTIKLLLGDQPAVQSDPSLLLPVRTKSFMERSATLLKEGTSGESTHSQANFKEGKSQIASMERAAEGEIGDILQDVLKEPQPNTDISRTSEVAAFAVQSLIDTLESERVELVKIESYIQKVEEKDPTLMKVIAKSGVVPTSGSLTEKVIQMIMAALTEESQKETDTSDIPTKVVTSLIKLIDKSLPAPESDDASSKSASSVVNELVDTIGKDLEKTIPMSPTNIANSVPEKNRRVSTTMTRIKSILQRIILDISSSHLTTDQIKDIASVAPNSKSPQAIILTLKSIIEDIDAGQFSIEEVSDQPSVHNIIEGDQTQPSPKTASDSGEQERQPCESTSAIIKDILNNVLGGLKLNELPFGRDIDPDSSSGEMETYKQDQVRSWILHENRLYCDDSQLIQSIAEKCINCTIERINGDNLSKSETLLLADAINQKVTGKEQTDNPDVARDFVLKTLKNTLQNIQNEGLSAEATDNLVRTVLQVILMNTKPSSALDNLASPSVSKKNDVVGFLSKLLGHLLRETKSPHECDDEDTGTEKDSFDRVVVGHDPNKGSQSSLDSNKVDIAPTVGGEELHLDKKTTATALSAISIRGTPGVVNPHDPIARNSFRDLHHPDLTRTEVLSHGLPQEVEAKLQKVAEQNLHLVHDADDCELTTIAEAPSTRTCSSSSASGSPTDLDGKLENIVSFTSPAEEPVVQTTTPADPSIRSNINTNSPKPVKTHSEKGKAKVSRERNASKKPAKPDITRSPACKNVGNKSQEEINEGNRSKSICSSRKGQTKSSSKHSLTSASSSQQNIKLPQIRNTPSPKYRLKSKTRSDPVVVVKTAALSKTDTRGELKPKVPQAMRVRSLCGSHSTKVTIREFDESRL